MSSNYGGAGREIVLVVMLCLKNCLFDHQDHGGVAYQCMHIQGMWSDLVKNIPVVFAMSQLCRESRLLSVMNSLSIRPLLGEFLVRVSVTDVSGRGN